ncbi:MAG: hypothetical protein Q8L13_14100 [Bradyrhizobium sp.]|uniref:hypothetical protein n=1 Tax=Bradyrhizobium sp. TaxID=376 RepID=UPI00272F7805|nr:hypothetical protein [Bradyrhizobium sp.]MDP1867456.1 hypothetical protein [Bradyrhizobium sp.]
MAISSMFILTAECDAVSTDDRSITGPHNERKFGCPIRSGRFVERDRRDFNAHPVTATGHQAIWLQLIERKFCFFRVDAPFMSNTDPAGVFRCNDIFAVGIFRGMKTRPSKP